MWPLIKNGPVFIDLFLNFKKVFISDLANHLRALCQCLFRWFRPEIISDISVDKEFHLYPCKESNLYPNTYSRKIQQLCMQKICLLVVQSSILMMVWKMLMKVACDSSKSLLVCVQFWLICRKCGRHPLGIIVSHAKINLSM